MPPRIQNFSNMRAIVIHNSTVVSWEMDAALTAETHESLYSVSFVEANMSAVPPAILHDNMPMLFGDLAFSGTNLTKLPDEIDLYWVRLLRFCLEASPGITGIPSAIFRMFWLFEISFIDNSITFLPDDTFAAYGFAELLLSGNPLSVLPSTFGFNTGSSVVNIERTNIKELPVEWLELYANDTFVWTIHAGGTRLCERLEVGESVIAGTDSIMAAFYPELDVWAIDNLHIDCNVGPFKRLFGN